MALVKVNKKFTPGWNIGDHVEMTGIQLKNEVEAGNVVVITPDPVIKPVETIIEKPKKKEVK